MASEEHAGRGSRRGSDEVFEPTGVTVPGAPGRSESPRPGRAVTELGTGSSLMPGSVSRGGGLDLQPDDEEGNPFFAVPQREAGGSLLDQYKGSPTKTLTTRLLQPDGSLLVTTQPLRSEPQIEGRHGCGPSGRTMWRLGVAGGVMGTLGATAATGNPVAGACFGLALVGGATEVGRTFYEQRPGEPGCWGQTKECVRTVKDAAVDAVIEMYGALSLVNAGAACVGNPEASWRNGVTFKKDEEGTSCRVNSAVIKMGAGAVHAGAACCVGGASPACLPLAFVAAGCFACAALDITQEYNSERNGCRDQYCVPHTEEEKFRSARSWTQCVTELPSVMHESFAHRCLGRSDKSCCAV